MRRPPPNPDYKAEAIRLGISRAECRRLLDIGKPQDPHLADDLSYDHAQNLEAQAAQARADMAATTDPVMRRHYEVVACNREAAAILERIAVDSWNDRAAKLRAYDAWLNEPEMEIAA